MTNCQIRFLETTDIHNHSVMLSPAQSKGFFQDFNDFNGIGFAPNPIIGQLDSNVWSVKGLSDGDLDFGEMGTTGDFAREVSSGGVSSGGVYAFEFSTGDRI